MGANCCASATRHVARIVCALWLIAGCASPAEGERIVLRAADGGSLEEIRVSLGASRVRTVEPGGQIWELPAGTRAAALSRYRGDPRLAYIRPLDGSEMQLFADPAPHDLTVQQAGIVAKLDARPTSGELRTAALQAGPFTTELLAASGDEPFDLNLLPGRTYQAVALSVVPRVGGYTWVGGIGSEGKATLVVSGLNVSGQIDVLGHRYSIAPLGDGLHVIYEVNPSAFPPEHAP